MSFPTTGLIRRCEPAQIVSAAGRVSQWTDASGAGNHLLQATGGNQPFDSGAGYVCFDNGAYWFDDTISVNRQSHTRLILSIGIGNYTGYTRILSRLDTTGNLTFAGNNNQFLALDSKVSGFRGEAALNLCGFSASASALKLHYNDQSESFSALGPGTESGGVFGGFSFGGGFSSRANMSAIHEWDHALDAGEWAAFLAYVATTYGLVYTKTAQVITIGDSRVQGVAGTGNLSWQQRMGLAGNIRLINCGHGGAGLTGAGGNPNLFDEATMVVDNAFDAAIPNILYIAIGINDFRASQSAADVYAALVTYCQARKAAHPAVKIVLATVESGGSVDPVTVLDPYNALIRANSPSICDAIADVAAATISQFDGLHPDDAGMATIAPIAKAPILSLLPAPVINTTFGRAGLFSSYALGVPGIFP